MNANKTWKFVERFKLLLELVIALGIASPVIFVLARQGMDAVIPLWLSLLLTAFAICFGYLLGRRPLTSNATGGINRKKPLQSIRFNYEDSPVHHGWKLKEANNESAPAFKHELDGFYGKVLKIRPTSRYAMDLDVSPRAQIGRNIEIITKLSNGYAIYALVSIQGRDGSKFRDVHLNFRVGDGRPRQIGTGVDEEWEIYVTPEEAEGEWSLLRIELDKALASSVGQLGWAFRKLRGLRLRGKLDMASINIY